MCIAQNLDSSYLKLAVLEVGLQKSANNDEKLILREMEGSVQKFSCYFACSFIHDESYCFCSQFGSFSIRVDSQMQAGILGETFMISNFLSRVSKS